MSTMTRTIYIAVLFCGLNATAALAAAGDCGVNGGGVFDATVTGPADSGDASFGGSIVAKGCQIDSDIHGSFFIHFADGSTFRSSNFDSFAPITLAGDSYYAIVIGMGTFKGEVYSYELELEEALPGDTPAHIVLQLDDPFPSTIYLDARGDVTRGNFDVFDNQ